MFYTFPSAVRGITSAVSDSSIIKVARFRPWLGPPPFPVSAKGRHITEHLHIPSRLNIFPHCREAGVKYQSELSSLCWFELPARSIGVGHSSVLVFDGKTE